MPVFTGIYQLAGDPPEKWEETLRSHASSSGVEVRSISKPQSRRLVVTIHVPESTSASASPHEIAKSFFDDLVPLLSEVDGRATAQLLSISSSRSRRFLAVPALKALGTILLWVLGLAIALVATSGLSDILNDFVPGGRVAFYAFIVLGGLAAAVWFLYSDFASEESGETTSEKEQQAAEERALVQEVAKGEDPAMRARLELARISLRMRASSMRGDADRLWRRSIWAYRGALGFFVLALAGPTVAATLLLTSPSPDWHFMFGGLSLAAVPLLIGTALLRHDTKLREQHQEVARDVASLERYELALDYARIASQRTYQGTMQQVIAQLLSIRTGPPTQVLGGADGKKLEKEGGDEESPGLKKMVDVVTEKAGEAAEKVGEVVTSLVQTKSGG